MEAVVDFVTGVERCNIPRALVARVDQLASGKAERYAVGMLDKVGYGGAELDNLIFNGFSNHVVFKPLEVLKR